MVDVSDGAVHLAAGTFDPDDAAIAGARIQACLGPGYAVEAQEDHIRISLCDFKAT